MSAIFSMSAIFEFGFPSVSRKIAFVLSLIALSKESSDSGLTNVVVTPEDRGNVCASRLYVPPYMFFDATICSPLRASAHIV